MTEIKNIQVKRETERNDPEFTEPASGNGNFLAKVQERKPEAQ